MRKTITARFKSLGFNYIAADLNGYRQGSLNEVLE
jgi:PP-loop superfamily ATP-utilizing enzyme